MTRHAARALLALALLATAAPAASAASAGEIVLVTNGPATGTVTLPTDVRLGFGGARYDMKSPYALLAFVQGGEVRAAALHLPALHDTFDDTLVLPPKVRAGRATVRVLTAGPATIRIPASGLRGRLVVRLRTPLRGTVGHYAAPTTAGGVARDDLPVHVDPHSITVHGYLNDDGTAVAHADSMCLSPDPCTNPWATPGGVRFSARYYYPFDHLAPDQRAQLVIADAGTLGKLAHVVVSLPV